MLTGRGAALLISAVALLAVGRLLGVRELYIVSAATAALVGAAVIAVRLSTSTIAVRRGVHPDRIMHGGSVEALLELRNEARVPAALLLVEDTVPRALGAEPQFVVPGLGAGRTATLTYPLTGRRRGRFHIGPVRIRVRDPFNLAQRTRRYSGTDDVLVYPPIERLQPLGAPGSHHVSGTSAVRRLFTTGEEFYTMREYVTGDDLRQVHWPSTAHRQTLMVRQQEQPWQAEATVLCDTRHVVHHDVGPHGSFEKTVSVAASVIWHLADERYGIRLVTTGDTQTPHARTRAQVENWHQALDRLAEIKPARGTTLAVGLEHVRRKAEGLLVAVVAPPPGGRPVADHPDVVGLVGVGRRFGGRLAIVVAAGDGRATERAEQTVGTLRASGWRAAVVTPSQQLAPIWASLGATRRRPATRPSEVTVP